MTTLVVGASGATGRLLVEQLLARGEPVKAMVRPTAAVPEAWHARAGLTLIRASLPGLGDAELAGYAAGCGTVASCLGHNLTLRGVFGPPRRLVTDAVRRLCDAVRAGDPDRPVRVVLMNSAGNRNRDQDEPVPLAQRAVLGLLRLLVPPHADNEAAADYLRTRVRPTDPRIQWVVVRPDSLGDAPAVTRYDVHPSPIRSAIFDPGRTSRINVAHFMAELAIDDRAWRRWRGQMPVIYDRAGQGGADEGPGAGRR